VAAPAHQADKIQAYQMRKVFLRGWGGVGGQLPQRQLLQKIEEVGGQLGRVEFALDA